MHTSFIWEKSVILLRMQCLCEFYDKIHYYKGISLSIVSHFFCPDPPTWPTYSLTYTYTRTYDIHSPLLLRVCPSPLPLFRESLKVVAKWFVITSWLHQSHQFTLLEWELCEYRNMTVFLTAVSLASPSIVCSALEGLHRQLLSRYIALTP